VLLFKTLASLQLFYHYFFPTTTTFKIDFFSIAMILIGYFLSIAATNAIGIDRFYLYFFLLLLLLLLV
jgi:hypothetical protein